jgi:hypothetical protein
MYFPRSHILEPSIKNVTRVHRVWTKSERVDCLRPSSMTELTVSFDTSESGTFKILELPPDLIKLLEDDATRPKRWLLTVEKHNKRD